MDVPTHPWGRNLKGVSLDGLEDVWLHGEEHEAGKTTSQVQFYRGKVPVVLALLERNAHEVGFADNLGEHRVRENRPDLVGVERHRSSVSDSL